MIVNAVVEEKRAWWSQAVMIGGLAAIVLPLIGALGTRFDILNFQIGLLLWAVGCLIALISVVAGVIAAIVVLSRGRVADRAPVFFGTAIAALMVVFLGAQFVAGRNVPPMHDVSTDMDDPPAFDDVVVKQRSSPGINTLDYDAAKLPPMQKGAYPQVAPLELSAQPDAVFDAVTAALPGLGLAVVQADRNAMIVEAVATSFWFGFKDDVVVRIRPTDTGSRIDVRSVSRVGIGDVGVNAKRIMKILDAIKVQAA